MGLFIALAALMASAQAGPFAWRWDPAAPQRFHAEVVIDTPEAVTLVGAANLEARVVQTVIAADFTCTPAAAKKGWTLDCAYTSVAMKGKAVAKDQGSADALWGELAGLLGQAHMQIQVRPDGGLKDLDLEGVPKGDARRARQQEQLRMLSKRVVAPLFVVMPKGGEDPGKAWKVSGFSPAFELLDESSTTGGVSLETAVVAQAGNTWKLRSEGKGSVATQVEVEGGIGASTAMKVLAESRFDPQAGLVVFAEQLSTGDRLAVGTQLGGSPRYSCAGWVGRVNADGTVEGADGPMKLQP